MTPEAEVSEMNMHNMQQILKKNIEADISELERKKTNIETQYMDLKIRLESERKHFEQEKKQKFTDESKDIRRRENKLSEDESVLELKESALKDREKNIEEYEVKLGDVNKLKQTLLLERSDFLDYKDRIIKELELKKVEIKEIEGKWKHLEAEEDRLRGVEISLTEKALYLDKEIGLLHQQKKEFEDYKNNIIDPKSVNKNKKGEKDVANR